VRTPRPLLHRVTAAALLIVAASLAARAVAQSDDSNGWQIPQRAASEPNPVPDTPETVAKGRNLYRSKCERCHGATGKGNGRDADREHPPGDLTDMKRASRNPDGVMFYKIWNGRSSPKMPAFKADISREDVWTVIQYVKTLRQPAG
jgi:mono/diheme cytochrome c family protein